MIKKHTLLVVLFFIFLSGLFFYQTLLHGNIPFPGDLLINYVPWKYDSFLGFNPGSYPTKSQYFDVLRQIYPWTTFAIGQIKQGQFPLWNPYNFSGAPLFANSQSAILYPLHGIYLFVPQIVGWTLLLFLQTFLTLLFTYLYAQKIKLSSLASLFVSVSFTFCSFLSVWFEYNTIGQVIVWLPLLLVAIESLLEKQSKIWIGIFVFAIVSALFAGHIQIFGYEILFVCVYTSYRIVTDRRSTQKKKLFMLFTSLLLLGIGLGSVQLFPTLELIYYSARSVHTFSDFFHKILIQPYQLVMLFVPDFFGNPATRNYWLNDTYIGKVTSIGIVSLLLSTVSLVQLKNNFVKFYLASIGIILLLVTANPFSFLFYHLFSGLTTSAPTLAVFLLCLSLSVLSGFGVDSLLQKQVSKKRLFITIISFLLFFVSLWILVLLIPKVIHAQWVSNLSITKRNLLYTTGILLFVLPILGGSLVKKKYIVCLLVLLFLIQVGDSFRFFEKFNPFVPRQLVFPKNDIVTYLHNNRTIDRIYGFSNANIQANFTTEYQLYSPEGYDPLYPRWYGEFIQSTTNGQINTVFSDQTRSDAMISPGFDQKNINRLRVLDILGTHYILDRVENGSSQKEFPTKNYSLIYHTNGWNIFQNNNSLPRFFFTSDYQLYTSPQDFSRKFFSSSFHPLQTVLLTQNLPTQLDPLISFDRVDLTMYTPNLIRFATHTQGNHLLFLSDTYYPGWKAFIDGKETPIYLADYAFRAILLPKGSHEVVFTFDSASFGIGILVSVVSLTGLVFFLMKKEKQI